MEYKFNGDMKTLPLLALRGYTVFPNTTLHFEVARGNSIHALEAAVEGDQLIFLITQKDIRTEEPHADDLFKTGTISRVRQLLRLPGDNIRVMVEGLSRAALITIDAETPYMKATVGELQIPRVRKSSKTEALIRNIREIFDRYAHASQRVSKDVSLFILAEEDPHKLADFIGANLNLKYQDKQMILSEPHPVRRLERVLEMLEHEAEVLELENDISSRVKEQMDKNQRDYFLREQIKSIQSELGEKDDPQSEADEYRKAIASRKLSEEVAVKLNKEVDRMARLQPGSPETGVIRTYLDICLELPWEKRTNERLDIAYAQKCLDADHYGLEKVKERIIEYVATRKLTDKVKSQIICLVGPPGTGKTSIALSISKVMHRKIARISLGGISDEAEIRGHRRTYVGSMPGRIINAVRQAGSKNCVMVLDEVDKLGRDYKGDPSFALLEVLDPEQNKTFRDHYIEMPFDLSEVLFIMTANTMDTIPAPLLDRMEVIELSGYTDNEKLHIAKKYLLAKQMKAHGIVKARLQVRDDALAEIISGYTRESGVRGLERTLAKICRKAAVRINKNEKEHITVNAANLSEFLGPRKYHPTSRKLADEVGVVNGLAYTSAGGEMLEVEVNVVDGTGKLELTGNLGDVMKESAKAAVSYVRSRCDSFKIDKTFYKNKDIHIHFPEGAVPKDGPSAGITIATAIVSALTNAPVRRSFAMTGEITLRGRVLPIGGLKEKTMAAYREGIKTVIIPAENEKDLEEIDQTVREGLTFITVDHADQAILKVVDFENRAVAADPSFICGSEKYSNTITLPEVQ